MDDETKQNDATRMFAFDMESLMRMGMEDEASDALKKEAEHSQPAEAMEPELKRLKELMGWK